MRKSKSQKYTPSKKLFLVYGLIIFVSIFFQNQPSNPFSGVLALILLVIITVIGVGIRIKKEGFRLK